MTSPSKRAKTGQEAYYRVIDGVKYDRELLAKAEACAKSGGRVSLAEATELWEDAGDGRTLTPVEKQTLHYALEIFAFSAKAKKFLESKLHPKKGSYFKTIDRVRYDRELLEKAEGFAGAGNISQDQAEELWSDALDGNQITDCEVRTLQYIIHNLSISEAAQSYLEAALQAAAAEEVANLATPFVSPALSPGSVSKASRSSLAKSELPATPRSPASPPPRRPLGHLGGQRRL
ncbi:unnamed protein product [Effrenium voratum]|nr:unnamed protein product [Effrenium voratum]